jgi:hypothetical protein
MYVHVFHNIAQLFHHQICYSAYYFGVSSHHTFTFTEYGTVLTTILPILFLYLNTAIVTAGAFEP